MKLQFDRGEAQLLLEFVGIERGHKRTLRLQK